VAASRARKCHREAIFDAIFRGTRLAIVYRRTHAAPGAAKTNRTVVFQLKEFAMTTGSKMFWVMLWLIGLPLPLLVILWFLFGSR
jgi:hypothetical protein